MKKVLLLIVLVIVVMGLSACSADDSNNENHGINVIPVIHSNGDITTILIPY